MLLLRGKNAYCISSTTLMLAFQAAANKAPASRSAHQRTELSEFASSLPAAGFTRSCCKPCNAKWACCNQTVLRALQTSAEALTAL